MRITFIGGGNMATALIGGLLANRRPQPAESHDGIRVIEPVATQAARLAGRFGVRTYPAISAAALETAELVVLAVKPQQMRAVAEALNPLLAGRLVISIAAGVRMADLSIWLGGHRRLVRCMPNTPALIGHGITGLAAPAELSEADRQRASDVLAAVGETVWVASDQQIDAVTAVSGSGPAYVFHWIESLESGALALGLEPAVARQLALATFRGAALLASDSPDSPAVLRERVTSKGGTTAAALAVLRQTQNTQPILQAVQAAFERAGELADEIARP